MLISDAIKTYGIQSVSTHPVQLGIEHPIWCCRITLGNGHTFCTRIESDKEPNISQLASDPQLLPRFNILLPMPSICKDSFVCQCHESQPNDSSTTAPSA